eukprot:GHVT01072005.1.p1 GENE.GHVT01072005.1~~GHVT01072005.1.p1  ORF type:complete len:107 (+),score=0.78 GHVT01072005.1:1403-1723(+)
METHLSGILQEHHHTIVNTLDRLLAPGNVINFFKLNNVKVGIKINLPCGNNPQVNKMNKPIARSMLLCPAHLVNAMLLCVYPRIGACNSTPDHTKRLGLNDWAAAT